MKTKQILTLYDEKLPESVKLPTEAYLYFPTGLEIKSGEGKKGVRRIFQGQVTYDTFELEMIQVVKETALKQKDEKFDVKAYSKFEKFQILMKKIAGRTLISCGFCKQTISK